MTRFLPILLLASCSAQATEPELKDSERLRIETFASECLVKFDQDKCMEACSGAFPDDHSSGNQDRWLICFSVVAKEGGA